MAGTRDLDFEVGVVAVAWVDNLYSGTVPFDINECGASKRRTGEGRSMVEADFVLLASGGAEWRSDSESSGEGVVVVRRSKETDAVAGAGVRREEKDGGVLGPTWSGGADPVGVRFGEAEGGAGSVTLEATIDNEVLALVATRLCYFETMGAGCGGGGCISGDVIL